MPAERASDLLGVERAHGQVASYMTRLSAQHLAELKSRVIFVPTTTRNRSQYDRLELPGSPSTFAIIANGAIVLENGIPAASWTRRVLSSVAADGVPPDLVRRHVEAVSHRDFTIKLRSVENLFCYIVVNREREPADFVADQQQWGEPRGWQVCRQGRKIYWVPKCLGKHLAMREIADRVDAGVILAAGDSPLDVAMLNEADGAIRPAHGELDPDELKSHVVCTARTGALAGEEITGWLLDQLTLS